MPPPSVAWVFAFPAAIPATWVPCSDCSGSNGTFELRGLGEGAWKVRATITLAVVYAACPLGKPGGIAKPAGSKNGCRWSIPSSMIPIFVP